MPPKADENDPPVVKKAEAVETDAYKDKTPPAKTVAVWAVPLEVSFASKPFERAASSMVASEPVFPATTATAPALGAIAV